MSTNSYKFVEPISKVILSYRPIHAYINYIFIHITFQLKYVISQLCMFLFLLFSKTRPQFRINFQIMYHLQICRDLLTGGEVVQDEVKYSALKVVVCASRLASSLIERKSALICVTELSI